MKILSLVWQSTLMALQYLNGRKLRTFLTTLAIVFGIALMFAVNVMMPSILAIFESSMAASSGAADLSITSVTGETFEPEIALQTITASGSVETASGVLRRPIVLPGKNSGGSIGEVAQIELIGVDAENIQQVRPFTMSEGRFLEAGDTGKAVLPASIAELAPQIKVGTTFPLITAGGLKFYTVVGFFATSEPTSSPQIVVPLADAQAALNQPGLINVIDIALKPGVDRNAVASEILSILGDNYRIDTPSSYLEALTSMEIGYGIFNMMGVIALFLGAFLIFNTFRTIIIERRRDLGMLRAIGAKRSQIIMMIVIESLIQGIIGTTLGLLLGFLLASSLSSYVDVIRQNFIKTSAGFYATISLSAMVGPVVLGLLMTVAAGYFPARAASRISPLEAIRPAPAATVARAARRGLIIGVVLMVVAVGMLVAGSKTATGGAVVFLIGMVIAAPGLVMPAARLFSPVLTLWYAREGDLAQGNLTRQPGRAAITASTLMIGLATFILMAAVVNGFEQYLTNLVTKSFASDILMMPQSISLYNNVLGADDSLTQRLSELPEVETVAGMRYGSTLFNDQLVQVLGIDPQVYPKLSQFDFASGTPEEAYAMLENERAMIINSLTARMMRVGVGDQVTLPTAEGDQTYRVAAIANDMLSFKLNAVFISQANLKADFHKAEDIMVMIDLKPDADLDAAFAKVNTISEDYPQFTPHITGEYRDDIMELSFGAMKLFYALGLVILIPAALGLLNTLTINVLERTREIGVLRAVGSSRGQVRRMVTAEALLLGLFGAATGVLAGIAMSYGFMMAFSTLGWNLPYQFPVFGVVAAVVIGLLLALFASILPARNAAKLDIIRAIQYE